MAPRKKPTRKTPAKRRSPPRKKASSGRSRRKKGPGPIKRGVLRLTRFVAAAVVGAGVGVVAVVGVLYHQATQDVEQVLNRPIHDTPGVVLSAPLRLWPGLQSSPLALTEDLVAAGYSEVAGVRGPGQVHASKDAVHLQRDDGQEVLVTFSRGRVQSVSPAHDLGRIELLRLSGGEDRRPIAFEDMPPNMVNAVLAMEDARFFQHDGIDPWGIARAIVANLIAGETRQGGSTLTQQLVKNVFLTAERSYERKGREAILALALEQRLEKKEILGLYLNEIYLGQHGGRAVYGVEQAARVYFGKGVATLSLGECATLAGIVSGPNLYSPARHPERAKRRRDLALERMWIAGFISKAAQEEAASLPLGLKVSSPQRRSPWLVDAAIDLSESQLGVGAIASQGLTLETTVHPVLQRIAEAAVKGSMAELVAAHPTLDDAQMALVAVSVSNGDVVAMVGGRDWRKSPFDRARSGQRQIGSTVKPLSAMLAFDDDPGLSPATVFVDEPIERLADDGTWAPGNYDGQFVGEITLRDAVAQSRNVPAVLLAEHVGYGTLRRGWRELGLANATALPSASLGAFDASPLALAGAYTALPGGGRVVRPRLLSRVTNEDGDVVFEKAIEDDRVVSQAAAFLAVTLAEEVLASGTGTRAQQFGVKSGAGGKTGTTDRGHDAWFVGFTPELAVAVWVGFDKGRPLGLTGAKAALPAWSRFVAGSGTARGGFSPPKSVEEVTLCAQSGQLATPQCEDTDTDWFQQGHAPEENCPEHGGLVNNVADAVEDSWQGIRRWFKPKRRKNPDQ